MILAKGKSKATRYFLKFLDHNRKQSEQGGPRSEDITNISSQVKN